MDTISFSELRAKLAEALAGLDGRAEPLMIVRRGRPTGVLMSVSQYVALVNEKSADDGPAARLAAWRSEYIPLLAQLEAEGDNIDPFANLRDKSSDRPVTWPDDIDA